MEVLRSIYQVLGSVRAHGPVHIRAPQIFCFTLIQQSFTNILVVVKRHRNQRQKPQNHRRHPGPAHRSLFPNFSKYSSVWSPNSAMEHKQHSLTIPITVFSILKRNVALVQPILAHRHNWIFHFPHKKESELNEVRSVNNIKDEVWIFHDISEKQICF